MKEHIWGATTGEIDCIADYVHVKCTGCGSCFWVIALGRELNEVAKGLKFVADCDEQRLLNEVAEIMES